MQVVSTCVKMLPAAKIYSHARKSRVIRLLCITTHPFRGVTFCGWTLFHDKSVTELFWTYYFGTRIFTPDRTWSRRRTMKKRLGTVLVFIPLDHLSIHLSTWPLTRPCSRSRWSVVAWLQDIQTRTHSPRTHTHTLSKYLILLPRTPTTEQPSFVPAFVLPFSTFSLAAVFESDYQCGPLH